MGLSNKPLIGASDFVYALLTESTDTVGGGTPTYGTVYSLPLATKVALNLNGSAVTGFGDDGPALIAETIGEIDLEADLLDLQPADEARIFGHSYANGQLTKISTDQSPYLAFGWKMLRTGLDSGTLVYDYVWLLKGRFMKSSITQPTKGASIKLNDKIVKGKFGKLLSSNAYLNTLRTDDPAAPSGVITNFFAQVTSSNSIDNSALSCVISKGTAGDSGKVIFTFSKVSGLSFSIPTSSITALTALVLDATSLRAGVFAVGGAGTSVIVKFTPSVSLSGLTVGCAVTNEIIDSNGSACIPSGITLTF